MLQYRFSEAATACNCRHYLHYFRVIVSLVRITTDVDILDWGRWPGLRIWLMDRIVSLMGTLILWLNVHIANVVMFIIELLQEGNPCL